MTLAVPIGTNGVALSPDDTCDVQVSQQHQKTWNENECDCLEGLIYLISRGSELGGAVVPRQVNKGEATWHYPSAKDQPRANTRGLKHGIFERDNDRNVTV